MVPKSLAGIRVNPQFASRAMAVPWSVWAGLGQVSSQTACQGRKDKRRASTSRLSSSFMVPLAALRGLAKRASPRASRRQFNSSQRLRERNTSPRTVRAGGASAGSRSGMSAMVRAFSVTSSPVSPSPRVSASTSTRFS